MDKMEAQKNEFDEMAKLASRYRNITLTPIVDDDYPEVRHYYESQLRTFLRAVKENRGKDYFKGL